VAAAVVQAHKVVAVVQVVYVTLMLILFLVQQLMLL
jgi:hypothetical protein